jgi:hypothetical protein
LLVAPDPDAILIRSVKSFIFVVFVVAVVIVSISCPVAAFPTERQTHLETDHDDTTNTTNTTRV